MNLFCTNTMFKDYLKAKRIAAGLSQQELADKISAAGYKVSNGKISYYERDYGKEKKGWTNRPPEEFVEYLAEVLNLNLSEVRQEAGYAPRKSSLPDFIFEIDFNSFTEQQLETIKKFIEFIKGQPSALPEPKAMPREHQNIVEQDAFEEIPYAEFSEAEVIGLLKKHGKIK